MAYPFTATRAIPFRRLIQKLEKFTLGMQKMQMEHLANAELAIRGIDVKGKIVIARYGGSWRGIKPKVAAEHGAIGCLIYSDPRNDGYYQGDVYP